MGRGGGGNCCPEHVAPLELKEQAVAHAVDRQRLADAGLRNGSRPPRVAHHGVAYERR